jgi:hypothetical protein
LPFSEAGALSMILEGFEEVRIAKEIDLRISGDCV